jgi:hypothetical protein
MRLILAPKSMEGIEEKLLKSQKMKDGPTQKDSYIDANQWFTRCGNHPNILPLFGRYWRSLTSLLSSLRHEAHPHLAK